MAKRKSSFTKDELTTLRAGLPNNWMDILTDKHKLTEGSIRNILHGHSINDDVVLSAFDLQKEHQAKLQQAKAALAS